MIVGLFWSGWTQLSVWVILAYFRERLLLDGKTVRQDGVIRSRMVDCEKAIRLLWRRWPAGGSIILRSRSEKISIHFHNFRAEECAELVRFFRETFPKEIQENWSRFEDCTRRLSPQRRPFSRGGVIASALVLMCVAPIFVYRWFAGLGVQYLLIGVANVAAALCCLWRLWTCKGRNVTTKATSPERPEC